MRFWLGEVVHTFGCALDTRIEGAEGGTTFSACLLGWEGSLQFEFTIKRIDHRLLCIRLVFTYV